MHLRHLMLRFRWYNFYAGQGEPEPAVVAVGLWSCDEGRQSMMRKVKGHLLMTNSLQTRSASVKEESERSVDIPPGRITRRVDPFWMIRTEALMLTSRRQKQPR